MKVRIGDKFRHFKGFTLEVKDIVTHTETLEQLVIYEHKGVKWARPLSMFLNNEDVSKRIDNVTGQKYRFERIEDNDRY